MRTVPYRVYEIRVKSEDVGVRWSAYVIRAGVGKTLRGCVAHARDLEADIHRVAEDWFAREGAKALEDLRST